MFRRLCAWAAAALAAACATDPFPPPQPTPVATAPSSASPTGLRPATTAVMAVRAPDRPSPTARPQGIGLIAVLRADPAERLAIARATAATVSCLAGVAHEVTRRYVQVPALAVRGGAEVEGALAACPSVAAIQPDFAVRVGALAGAIVKAYPVQTQLGWTGAGVRVAVIDSGVDGGHPDLAGKVVAQQCFAASGCPGGKTWGASAADDNGHGTHVAGIIAGQGKVAPLGIAPGAGIVAIRTVGADGVGLASDVVAALDWVAQHAKPLKIRVANLSVGSDAAFAGPCDGADPATALAVAVARKAGVAVFAAAGNEGAVGGLASPACLSGVVSVGATYAAAYGAKTWPGLCKDAKTGTATLACFSNRAKDLDLVAPGASVAGPALGGGKATMAGTSQACPVAAGAAALLFGCQPQLSADGVAAALRQTGMSIALGKTGWSAPRVNAAAAAALACP